MRKIVLLLGPVVATAALFACEDSGSGGNPGTFGLDSATFEASPPGEGGAQDAATDSPEAPTTVTVSVVRGAGPAAGVIVVFHDAAGSVTETKTTGADGKATSTPGAMPSQASALLGAGNQRRILTWTAVKPGDELLARDFGGTNAGTYEVTTQGNFADGGATSMSASIGTCEGFSATSPITVFMSTECARPTTAILARAFGLGDSAPRAYAFAKGKPPQPSDGGAGGATLGPWLAPGAVTVTPKNVPAQTGSFAALFEIADNLGVENPTGAGNRLTGVTTFKVAPGFADAYQAGLRVTPDLTPGAALTIAKRGAPAANTDIDFASPLPTIDTAKIITTSITQPQVDWSTIAGAPLTSTDGGAVFLFWADSRENFGTWTIIVPPGAKTVKAPALPAVAAPWAPHGATDAGAAVGYDFPTVVFVEADVLPGYDTFRSQVGLVLPMTNDNNPDARAILPANGTIKLTSFKEQPPL